MNQGIKAGNVYLSTMGAIYVVHEVGTRIATVRNIRNDAECYIRHTVLLSHYYELIGVPYEPEDKSR